jgi:hypothetical protein
LDVSNPHYLQKRVDVGQLVTVVEATTVEVTVCVTKAVMMGVVKAVVVVVPERGGVMVLQSSQYRISRTLIGNSTYVVPVVAVAVEVVVNVCWPGR